MTNENKNPDQTLREKAEEQLKKKALKAHLPVSNIESLQLIHELEVHQIQLEMQNEELARQKNISLESLQKYANLYDFAPSGYFTLSSEGEILDLNFHGAQILGKEKSNLINRRFGIYVSDASKQIFNQFFEKLFISKVKESCQLGLESVDHKSCFVQITGIAIRNEEKCLLSLTDITEEKQTETLLRDIIDKNPMSIQIVDLDGYTLQVNPAHYLLFGAVPPSDFSIFEDLKKSQPGIETYINQVKNGEVVHLPDIYYNPQNVSPDFPDNPLWIRAIIFPLKNSNGIVEKIVFMHENISERKFAEAKLKQSRDHYRLITESIKDVVWTMDAETMQFIYVSPSVEKLRGYTAEEIIAQSIESAMTTEAYIFVKNELQIIIANIRSGKEPPGKFYLHEVEQPCKDGSFVWTEVISSYYINPETNRAEVHGVTRDISKRKLATDALKAAKEKYKKDFLFQNSILESPESIIIFALDKNYCYTSFTRFHKETMKKIWAADIQIGMNILDIISDADDRKKAKINFDRALKGEYFVLIEEYGDKKLLRTFYEIFYNSMKDADGNVVGISVFVIDISARKKAEEELHIKINELENYKKLTVGRELRMIELKKQLNELLKETGREDRYVIVEADGIVE